MMILIFFYFLDALVASGQSHYIGAMAAITLLSLSSALHLPAIFSSRLRMFSDSMRSAQLSGCLEAMLSSQTSPLTIVLMSSLYGLISGVAQPLLILVALQCVYGGKSESDEHPRDSRYSRVFNSDICGVRGVVGGNNPLVEKGDPLAWILGGMGTLIGGAYFPIDVLPGWLQKVSLLIPNHLFSRRIETYHLEGVPVRSNRRASAHSRSDGRDLAAQQSFHFCRHGAKGSYRGNVGPILTILRDFLANTASMFPQSDPFAPLQQKLPDWQAVGLQPLKLTPEVDVRPFPTSTPLRLSISRRRENR